MDKLIKTIALLVLSLAVKATVKAQSAPQQWVLVITIETGDQIFIDEENVKSYSNPSNS